jgi:ATP-binding cassette, subfamily B, multidrug efflux pump
MAQRRGGPGGAFMTEKPRVRDAKGTLRRLWAYLRREQAMLIAVAVIVVAATGITVTGPYLIGRAIDDGIEARDLDALAWIVILLAVLYTIQGFLNWGSGWLMVKVGQRTVLALRNDLFTKLQSLPIRFFDQRPHGETMSRLTNDVENVNQVLSESLVQIISGLLSAVGIMILMGSSSRCWHWWRSPRP